MNITVLRTDGTTEQHQLKRADMAAIKRLIGCETIDTVMLSRDAEGARHIMIVDDDGWECVTVDHGNGHLEMKPVKARKPINTEATRRYHAVCKPGVTHQIVGDVAIADDRDFA
jgi:hypothetical protein